MNESKSLKSKSGFNRTTNFINKDVENENFFKRLDTTDNESVPLNSTYTSMIAMK